jgi:hypothetical protein
MPLWNTGTRWFRWFAAPLLLLGLLTPQTTGAAPSASLVVSPNPVVFLLGAKTVGIHLTWSTGDASVTAPNLCHNYGGVDVSCTPLEGASGTEELTIPTSTQAYTLKLKRSAEPAPDQDVLATTELTWKVDDPSSLAHPGNFSPPSLALTPVATLTTLKEDVVEDVPWYCSVPVPGKGLNLHGTGGTPYQDPSGVQIGYDHYFDPGVDPLPCSDKIDEVERGGIRFDMGQALKFASDHGIKGATLSFRLKETHLDESGNTDNSISCLDRIAVANDLWWTWAPNSHDFIPTGPISITVPHGNLRGAGAEDGARMNPDGSFSVDVGAILLQQLSFSGPTVTGSWVLIGQDESFPENNDVCLSSYDHFTLTLTGQR